MFKLAARAMYTIKRPAESPSRFKFIVNPEDVDKLEREREERQAQGLKGAAEWFDLKNGLIKVRFSIPRASQKELRARRSAMKAASSSMVEDSRRPVTTSWTVEGEYFEDKQEEDENQEKANSKLIPGKVISHITRSNPPDRVE